jgi:hypothetical protein
VGGRSSAALLATAIGFAGACAEPAAPPVLPGQAAPPCPLTSQSYLVDQLSLPATGGLSIDLSDPPDGFSDTGNGFYAWIEQGMGVSLPNALEDAVADHQLLWVLTVDTCTDPSNPYARVALRRGLSIGQGTQPVTRLGPEEYVPSVGEVGDGTIVVSRGIGVVPFVAPFDIAAASPPPYWAQAFMVYVQIDFASPQVIEGEIGLAAEVDPATLPLSDALARTLTAAHASEPSCPPTCSNAWLGGLIRAFDTNGDGVFTGPEVQASRYLSFLGFLPVLDLIDTSQTPPVFWPGHDGRDDALGSGYAFHASAVTALE